MQYFAVRFMSVLLADGYIQIQIQFIELVARRLKIKKLNKQ